MSILDLFGGNTDAEDRKARERIEEIRKLYGNLPEPELQKLLLENYEWQGDLDAPTTFNASTVRSPEDLEYDAVQAAQADTALVDDTAMRDIEVDPRLKETQIEALAALEGIADSGGMTSADVANLNRIQGDVAAADKGRRDAILQQMQMRGQGGSGMELLAQLQSAQAATDRQAQQSLDVAGMAQQRALEAMMQGGQMAGSIRGQDFGEQSQIAAARDAINKFNAGNQNSMNQFNTGATNDFTQFNSGNQLATGQFNIANDMRIDQFNAGQTQSADAFTAGAANDVKQMNWGARQDFSNSNTDLRNSATSYNTTELPQQQFENKKAITDGKASAASAEADYWGQVGDRKAQKAAEEFGAVTKGLTALGSAAITKSDERAKKDIRPVDPRAIEEFFSAFDPKTYRYKSKEDGEGDKVGLMLQDVQDTELGKKLIKEKDGVMHYDNQTLDGIMLAAISELMKGKK